MHSFKPHFSSPLVSHINGPTAHVFNTDESWTVCFHSDLFLKPVWHPRVLGWPSNDPIFLWQTDSRLWITLPLADEFCHGFSYFVWHVEVHDSGTSGSHLGVFSGDVAFAHHFVASRPSPPSHPIGVLMVFGYASKNYLKWQAIPLAIQCTAGTLNYLG